MVEAIAFAAVFFLIFQTRGRMGRIEHRLGLLEEAVRTRLRATPGDPLYQAPSDPASAVNTAPIVETVETVETVVVAVTTRPAPEVDLPPPLEPEPVEREPAMAMATTPVMPTVTEPASRGWSVNFEDLFGRRLPIWAGGITLAIAGVFIVKYAVDAGLMALLTPAVRVLLGAVFGFGLIAGAEAAMRYEDRVDDPRVRQALSGAGIATLYATVLIASNVYHLVGPLAAIIMLAMVTAGALALSIRFGAPSAMLGLVGGLAAPAMVGSTHPNVPLLAIYLALTIAGLAGVSRMQRWAWLGIAALVGGMGWSLLIIVASGALDVLGALSLGGFILLLTIAVPLFVISGPRAALFRAAAAVVGAAQLALMVALGGFSTVNWGLFILLAAAGQWLNRRESGLGYVPTISLALSILLLAIWPAPPITNFIIIGLLLAVVHAAPLFERLWAVPKLQQRTIELCAIALAVFFVSMFKFYRFDRDHIMGMLAIAAALIPAAGIAMGWRKAERREDARLAWFTGTAGVLLSMAGLLLFVEWLWPVAIALVAASGLILAQRAEDSRVEQVAGIFALVSLPFLALPSPHQIENLVDGTLELPDPRALLRWTVLAAVFAGFAFKGQVRAVRDAAWAVVPVLIYGLIAQAAPLPALPLIAPVLIVALAALCRTRLVPLPALGTLFALITAWALLPAGVWIADALRSLGAVPMTIDPHLLTTWETLKRVFAPAIALIAVLALRPAGMNTRLRLSIGWGAGLLAGIAAHVFYRTGFAAIIGGEFIETGVAQRLVWSALLIGLGVAIGRAATIAWRRYAATALIAAGTLHLLIYSLILHDPLWAAQHVGAIPVANLIAPLFALTAAGLILLSRTPDAMLGRVTRALQILYMLLVIGFGWATLRQAFHGTLLVEPGVFETEDILRSILGIVLAIGFLLWGIRSQQRDWRLASLVLMLGSAGKVFIFDASGLEGLLRIGSFVALGFSLIGIGWLYSRQLGKDEGAAKG